MNDKNVWTIADLPNADVVKIQNKHFPLVGGKLRVLREHFPNASVRIEQVPSDPDIVIYRAHVTCGEREATGTGTASITSDRALAESLHELAETRALARALRFYGIGVDSTGAEEVQGRRPIHDRQADEPPPLKPEDKPSPAQLAGLRDLLAEMKKRDMDVSQVVPPETAHDADLMLTAFTARLAKEA